MYSYEDRVRAVELYLKLGKRIKATIRQLGYPTKNSLMAWCAEFEKCGDLQRECGAREHLRFAFVHRDRPRGVARGPGLPKTPQHGISTFDHLLGRAALVRYCGGVKVRINGNRSLSESINNSGGSSGPLPLTQITLPLGVKTMAGQ